jgi:hypothetical protein
LALTACRRATRATDVPASRVSSTIRRFSSTDRLRLVICLGVSTVVRSEVSIYSLVDTSRCVHKGHHRHTLTLRPDGSDQTLTQKRGGYRIQEEDHPKKMPLSTAQLLRRAEHAGTQIGKLCQLIYQRQAETGIRRILGMHSLIKKYGAAAVEDACATALDIGVYEYRFVRRYLERRPHPQMFLRQIDPLIRELTEYRDFINLKIKEQPE